ncbi:SixA phosphatase family protein [Streptomyces sp. NPDC001903]|uniref:SixA phosphatase family protein n=1 Tax=Streptomyces sp. NPDC001903 TaxID=3364622 RepID=UPI0036766482
MAQKKRRIVVVRHAKAVPKHIKDDIDRELVDRGRHDAAQAGRRLARSGVGIDLALCSPALRTRQTWQLMLPELSAPPTTVYEDRLYHADTDDLLRLVAGTSSGLTGLVVVGHNPGVRELVTRLCGDGPEQLAQRVHSGFPKSAYAVLTMAGDWEEADSGTARLDAFWAPGDD